MIVEKRNRIFGSFFGNHLSGSFIMSVAKEFTTDRNTDVKTAGNRVIEGCNSLLVTYTRDSFKVRAGLPTENKNAVSLAIEGGEPSADGRGSAPPELAEQQARAGSEAAPATPPL